MNKLNSIFMTLATLTTLSAQAAAPAIQAGTYTVDPMHTKVGFEISHLVISTVEGRFNNFTGTITLGEKIDSLSFETSIDVDSIDTGIKDRDTHLKSPDFFDAAKFPKITFKSKKVSGPADKLKVEGDLTIKGVTKSVTLDAKYLGVVADPYGQTKAAFSAATKISRKDFGLTWNKAVEAGPVVGDEVTITVKAEAAKVVKK